MIKRIELINFMSHAHTVIEPAQGLTVLVGPNNCGKSAVMSALQILAHNDTSTYVTRHGEKECTIIVETTEGDVIEWNRKRSTTKYTVNGKTFDRLKGKVPAEVNDILRLPTVKLDQSNDEFDIHFGNQKKPVFLINESGRAAAGFFAASSDASRLIEMQKLHKQQTKDASRDLARLQDEQKILDQNAQNLAQVPSIVQDFESCNALHQSIEIHESAIQQLGENLSRIDRTQTQQSSFYQKTNALGDLTEPPSLHPTQQLDALVADIDETKQQVRWLKKRSVVLNEVPKQIQPHETKELNEIIEQISVELQKTSVATKQKSVLAKLKTPPKPQDLVELKDLIDEIQSESKNTKDFKSELKTFSAGFKRIETEIKTYSKSNPVCPTCNQPITSKALIKTVKGESYDS